MEKKVKEVLISFKANEEDIKEVIINGPDFMVMAGLTILIHEVADLSEVTPLELLETIKQAITKEQLVERQQEIIESIFGTPVSRTKN